MHRVGIDLDLPACRMPKTVGPAFDRFVQNAIPELTTQLDYYDEHDAMRDYRDDEDFLYGY